MIRAEAKLCESDSDYARFARFYIAHSRQFRRNYAIDSAALHILMTLPSTRILTFENEARDLIGFIQYRFEEDTAAAFIESTILLDEHRSSRVFFEGFRDLVRYVCRDYPAVRHFRFHVLAENRYLNRLYGKFADKAGVRDSDGEPEFIYIAGLGVLKAYLRLE